MPNESVDGTRFSGKRRVAFRSVLTGLVAILIGIALFAAHPTAPHTRPSGAILREDFSHPSTGWKTSSGPDAYTAYAGGKYRMGLRRGGDVNSWAIPTGASFDAVRVQATVRATFAESEGLGVDCAVRESGSPALYRFLIMPATDEYLILRGSGRQSVVLAHGLDTVGVIHSGLAENTVEGDCATSGIHASLAISVNGVRLADVQDPDPLGAFAGIGLSVEAPTAASATFDDARMDRLPPSATTSVVAGASPQPPL
jgi:hypothetical protein